jgi:hypothetical protein
MHGDDVMSLDLTGYLGGLFVIALAGWMMFA